MKSNNRNRKGAILPLVAVVMSVLILLLGLMVELNWLYSTRFEAQSASDLSARSALAKLYDNEGQFDESVVEEAREVGVQIYGLNFDRSAPITTNDLVFGELDGSDEFQEISDDLRDITASRVVYSQRYTSMLGTLIAKNQVDLGVFSVAEAGRIDMVLAIDASRSMNRNAESTMEEFPPGGTSIHQPPVAGSRWFVLRESAEAFLAQLGESEAEIGLVTFGGGLDLNKLASPLDAQFSRVEIGIGSAAETGPLMLDVMDSYTNFPALGLGTSIYDAIVDSTAVLQSRGAPAGRFIVLFTDGKQATRNQRPEELVAAHAAAEEGVVIYTIGYDLDGGFLDEIADVTGGRSFSVASPQELEDAFSEIASLVRARIVQ